MPDNASRSDKAAGNESLEEEIPQEEYISAGDLDKYAYCPLSWWLSRQKSRETGEELKEGIKRHDEYAKTLNIIRLKEKEIKNYELIVIIFSLIASILAAVSVTFFYPADEAFTYAYLIIAIIWVIDAIVLLILSFRLPEKDRSNFHIFVVVLSIIATTLAVIAVATNLNIDPDYILVIETSAFVWLITATVFFYISLRERRIAENERRKLHLQNGTIGYIESPELSFSGKRSVSRTDKEGESSEKGSNILSNILVSKKWGLRGTPDAVIEIQVGENVVPVPVEMKSGRTPQGPFFSHIMQVAAYCAIVEERYKVPPPYGIIKYEKGVEFPVDWDEEVKKILSAKLKEMRGYIRSNIQPARNHNRAGKCRTCSRRKDCPQRIKDN